jgi:hypothetical protein
MFNPAATNVVGLTREEWETIFGRKPGGAAGEDASQHDIPKN